MTTTTRDRPVLFSGPMVRAILAGRKTQARRVMKPQPTLKPNGSEHWWPSNADRMMVDVESFLAGDDPTVAPSFCPYGGIGEHLWVREAWARREDIDPDAHRVRALRYLKYRADGDDDLDMEWHEYDRWRPSIHMPRWASRITLEITGVRVERLQAITEADACAEGVSVWHQGRVGEPGFDSAWCRASAEIARSRGEPRPFAASSVGAFRLLWDQINGKRGFGWQTNCWVWAIAFRRIGGAP